MVVHAPTRNAGAIVNATRPRFDPSAAVESSGISSGGFAALDERTHRETFRRLAWAAFVYAGVYLAAFTYAVSMRVRSGLTPVDEASSLVSTLASIAVGLVAGTVAIRGRISPERFPTVALLFEVVAALGISSAEWGWQFRYPYIPSEGILGTKGAGVHWVGVWIAVFPMIVPLPVRRVLASSLAAAATLPAVAIASLAFLGPAEFASGDPGRNAVTYLLVITIPVLICAAIACVSADVVFRMTRRVSAARQLGSYRLTERLGVGGMGEVWKAEHRLLARPAAVKLIRPEVIDDRSAGARRVVLQRFEREAQATAALTSPHTVNLFDFGITDDGSFYSVMELLEGMDLKTLVERTGPVPPGRAVRMLLQACDSLADAHARGLVHRDVKPSNLFVCRQGLARDWIKVLDFGLVKTTEDEGEDRTQLTREGTAHGTPAFMAPEMAIGRAAIDGRADLYALGCVGYWLLSGGLVFEGETPMAILTRHVSEPPPRLSERTEIPVPAPLEELLFSCLAKDPAERPASAQELSRRLVDAERHVEPWTPERAERWWQSHLPAPVSPVLGPGAPA
jgi:serine/threonine-protein kinase